MELGNSWVVELAVLRENESGSDSWRRTDLGAEGSSLGYWESASFPGTYSSYTTGYQTMITSRKEER